MSDYEKRSVRKEIYSRWFTGQITYDEMIFEIAQVR